MAPSMQPALLNGVCEPQPCSTPCTVFLKSNPGPGDHTLPLGLIAPEPCMRQACVFHHFLLAMSLSSFPCETSLSPLTLFA